MDHLSTILSRKNRTPITIAFIICCVMLSILSNLYPIVGIQHSTSLRHISKLQALLTPFQHGYDAISGILFLSINTFIMWHFGRITEKLIGSVWTFIVILSSLLIYAFAQYGLQIQGHGAGGIIWAFSPIVLFILIETRKDEDAQKTSDYFKLLKNLLFLSWLVIPMLTGLATAKNTGDQGSIWQTYFYANIFYIISVIVGYVFAILLRSKIHNSLFNKVIK